MWKKVGSVHSNDNRSQRSCKRLSPDHSFQCFRRDEHSASRNHDRSFSIEYIHNRPQARHNMTQEMRSQKSMSMGPTSKEDIFSAMRQAIKKGNGSSTHLDRKQSKNSQQRQGEQVSKFTSQKRFAQMNRLKKQHVQLKEWMRNQFDSFKNMMHQMEQAVYQHNQNLANSHSSQKQYNTQKIVDHELLSSIVQEAREIEKYFANMDRKKDQILSRLE